MIRDVWQFKGRPVTTTWLSLESYDGLRPITQAYGVCFTPDNKLLVCRDTPLKRWNLPGGTIEEGESPEATLIREVDEEASADLLWCKLIGAFEVDFPRNPNPAEGDHFYQLRYAAATKQLKQMHTDPATGNIPERRLIEPVEFRDYIQWGLPGDAMFQEAQAAFQQWRKIILK